MKDFEKRLDTLMAEAVGELSAGLSLAYTQEEIQPRGHAIECRINAEDPFHGFRPAPGTVGLLHLPGGPGVRVDTALYPGCTVSPCYDSLCAKIAVHAPTRLEAVRRMRRALEEMVIEGITTTADLGYLICYHQDFITGRYDTSFLERHLEELLKWEM